MNVLVISHTYITKVGREKWRELARNYDINLRIVVPTMWKDYLFTLRYDEQRDDELDMQALPVWFSGKEAAHLYKSSSMTMNEFQPDIMHVEEGTDAFSYYQALHFKKFYAPKAKTLFFTWMNFEKTLKFPFTYFERYNLKRSDAAICGNVDARDILREKGFENPIHVMPLLGLDADLFSKRDGTETRNEIKAEGLVIGFIGRFVEEKGVYDLIDACATLNTPFTLLMIGGGALQESIKQRANERGIGDKLRLVISIPHKEVPRYINAMDMLVLPSYTVPHWKEQFGQVLVQAMASEVPVLGSTHAEIPRVIGDAGLTFEERNTDDLVKKLTQLVESSELRSELGPKGRARVLELYTNTKIAERTYKVYEELLGNS
jgi:glycosyltransferase involved in cell wall biosynthesis